VRGTQTPGGNRLRALREARARTQMDVELDASLGIGYLQRVESGKVHDPERDTLERILAALGARYTERRDILELFGYVVDAPLPDEADIAWAVDACRAELDEAVFPTYLLDCAHRLLAWNDFLARLFPLQRFAGQRLSMQKLLFDPAYGVTGLIANPDDFFPASIRALRNQIAQFRGEAWYDILIDDLRRTCPLFETHWSRSEPQEPTLAARPLVPLLLSLPGAGRLRFRVTSESFAQDRRFRILYYLPADPETMQQCAAWVPLRGS
jgi:transcriptional regulator with XRE-family HTH domain